MILDYENAPDRSLAVKTASTLKVLATGGTSGRAWRRPRPWPRREQGSRRPADPTRAEAAPRPAGSPGSDDSAGGEHDPGQLRVNDVAVRPTGRAARADHVTGVHVERLAGGEPVGGPGTGRLDPVQPGTDALCAVGAHPARPE